MADRRVGPLVLPWRTGDELALILLCALAGAVLGATILHHYRRGRGRTP